MPAIYMESITQDYADSASAARKGVCMAAEQTNMKTPADNENITPSTML